jgi:hypothetical protein
MSFNKNKKTFAFLFVIISLVIILVSVLIFNPESQKYFAKASNDIPEDFLQTTVLGSENTKYNYWKNVDTGLAEGFLPLPSVSYQGEIYSMINYPYKHSNQSARGLYKLLDNKWQLVAPWSSSHNMTNFTVDNNGDFWAIERINIRKLNKNSTEWQNIGKLPHNISDEYIVSSGDKIYNLITENPENEKYLYEFDIATSTGKKIPFPKVAGPIFSLGINKFGNPMLGDRWGGKAYTNEDSTKKDAGAVHLWNGENWVDYTKNLDQANSTNGKCCGMNGELESSMDGEHIFTSTEHGIYKYDYESENWQKIYSEPYGYARDKGTGNSKTAHSNGVYTSGSRYIDNNNFKFVFLGKNSTNITPNSADLTFTGNNSLYYRTYIKNIIKAENNKVFAYYVNERTGEGAQAGMPEPKNDYGFAILEIDPYTAFSSRNFTPEYMSYIGSSEDDNTVSVEISADKQILIAGNYGANLDFDNLEIVNSVNTDLNSKAKILVMNENYEMKKIIPLGSEVYEMEASLDGNFLAVVFDSKVAVFDKNLNLLWQKDLGILPDNFNFNDENAIRVDIDSKGYVATLFNKNIKTFDNIGTELATKTPELSYITDIAIESETDKVFVSSFNNQYNTIAATGVRYPVQVARLESYSINELNYLDKLWGFNPDNLDEDMADTRLYRVDVNLDGKLYLAGESAGGNTIFRWDGRDLQTKKLISKDSYSEAWNTASAHIGYFAKVDPVKMSVESGQIILNRNISDNKGNSFRARAITVDEGGKIFIGGSGACCSEGRDQIRIFGEPVKRYSGFESSLLVVDANWKSRKLWTGFTSQDSTTQFNIKDSEGNITGTETRDTGDNGKITDIVSRYGLSVAVGNTPIGKIITSDNANQRENKNPNDTDQKSDSYIISWKQE